MWNWTEQTLISQGQGWLRSLAQLTQFRDSRPGVRKPDEPHQTMSLSVICLKSGKVEGEGSGEWSVFSRMGEWCLNTKINLFHFQKKKKCVSICLIWIYLTHRKSSFPPPLPHHTHTYLKEPKIIRIVWEILTFLRFIAAEMSSWQRLFWRPDNVSKLFE